jgi:hypothetical protein
MRTIPLLLSTTITLIFATVATTDDKPPATAKGVVIDLRGPPEDVDDIKIDFLITLEGQKEPTRHAVSGGWEPTALMFWIHFWEKAGYVVEKAGETRIRFVGWKDKNGKVTPVVGIKFESKHLRPEQFPTVVPKNKG